MNDSIVPVNTPLLDGNEKKYLAECIETGWISSEGPFVTRLEKEFSQKMGRKHGIAVCNGSAALDAALQALNLKPGSEVILPSFTIISCAAAVIRAGLIPVFVDSTSDTWNMDPLQVESKITPRTQAIMAVHLYGLPVDMDPLLALAQKHNLRLIEDAAQAIGLKYKNRPCGSFGDISTFSFYPNKHITTGEGGMVVTDEPELASRLREIRNLCFIPERRFFHRELGYNFRMSNLQAAVGCAQLERLDEFLKIKRHNGSRYWSQLHNHPHLELAPLHTDYAENLFWVFGVVLKETVSQRPNVHCAEWVMKKLTQYGIGTRPFFYSLHEQPVFQTMPWYKASSLPVAERLARRGFYLPSGLGMSNEDIDRSVDALIKVLKEVE